MVAMTVRTFMTWFRETLNDIKASASVTLASGGRVTLSAALLNLAAGGEIGLDKASGQIQVKTDPPIDVAPLAAFGLGDVRGTGKVFLDANATFAPGGSSGDWSVRATGLSVAAREANLTITPTNLVLAGSLAYQNGHLEANTDFAGTLGALQVRLGWTRSAKPLAISVDKIYAALVEGNSTVTLPGFDLTAQGKLDLAEVGKSVPGLLPQIRPGVQIAAGSALEIPAIEAHGGANPWAEVRARLEKLLKTVTDLEL